MQLKPDFLIELVKTCLISNDILEAIKPYLSFTFISQEPLKHIVKYIFDYHTRNGKPPTLGLLSQEVTAKDTGELIEKIKNFNAYDAKEELLKSFEVFIKRARFIETYGKVGELYDQQRADDAYAVGYKGFEDLINFSMKTGMLNRIIADFAKRQSKRESIDYSKRKIPTGIPALDYHSRGGIELGSGMLGIARSGGYKSTFLRSLGSSAMFRGFNVLHFSSGDTKADEAELGYDAWWTQIPTHSLKEGLSAEEMRKVEKAQRGYIGQCGEIYTHTFRQFHNASIFDCRTILIEQLKICPIHLVLWDYLEKFDPGDKNKYNTGDDGIRAKKLATAEKMINVATEFDVAIATATQSTDIKKEIWNDPTQILTRSNISNLRATIDPFAYCITINQTEDEKDMDICRIHEEKTRDYKIPSWEQTYHIAQKLEVGRFVDLEETNKRFWDKEEKKVKQTVVKKKREGEAPVKKSFKVTDVSAGQ